MPNIFAGLAAKFVSAAKSFKSDVLKAANEVPHLLGVIEKDAPEVTALVELAFPNASAIETTAIALFEAVASAVSEAGQAVTDNGLNVTIDKALIQSVEAILPTLKRLISK
jgi:hypothetical protein